tara:strand:+ start:683 stop:1075 length:393 start_codon:yes stop_codon:yes gene_type:complete
MIPEDYKVIQIRCVDNADSATALCKTPNGTYAEYRINLASKTTTGVCPMCSHDMKETTRTRLFCDSKSHPQVIMSLPIYGKQVMMMPKTRIIPQILEASPMMSEPSANTANSPTTNEIKKMVAKALEDLI